MKLAVTGSSGLIGTALVARLQADGHDVVRLVRRAPRSAGEVAWEPAAGLVDLEGLAGVEAAVHLAGAGVGEHRWTAEHKRTIRDSRVLGTRTLATALTALDPLPRTLVCGSAIGFYGSRGEEELTEDSPPGEGFLAGVVRAWESECEPARLAGIRVVSARTGLVLSRRGGALDPMIRLIRLGLGGRLGNGRQWWSWITLDDEVTALRYLLESELSGPVNLTAPNPERNADVIAALGRALNRPTWLPAPGFALRAVIGELAQDVLASLRVRPARLLDAGFAFQHPDVDAAAAWVVQR